MNQEAAFDDMPFQEIADSAPVMLWRINSSFDCDWANKAWFDFTGGTLADQTGFAWVDLVHPDDSDRIVEAFGRAFEAREPVSVELRIRGRDGRYRWFLDSGSPYFSGSEFAGFVGSCVDITDRKEAEERSRLLCAQTVRLSRAEAALYARGSPRRPPARSDLANVLRAAEPLVLAHPEASGAAVEWRLAGGLEVELSPPEMELVIFNLAANAFEAMSGTARRRLRIAAAAWGALAIVAISDSGPGPTPELIQSLSGSLPSADGEGRGAGLYLCRSIVAALGGRIWAEQGSDGGAVVKFTLPLAP
jgi:PAS domain S-box-containing protein